MKIYGCLLISTLLAGTCQAQEKFDYSTHVGVVSVGKCGPYLSIQSTDLPPGTRLTIVWIPDPGISLPAKLMFAQVTGRHSAQCDIIGSTYGDSCYAISVSNDTLDQCSPCFGLIVPAERLSVNGPAVSGDIDLDGIKEEFRLCTSSEGIHLTIWSGKPLQGTRRWHRYYYLGYDVEPTCNENEYKEE
ncbi:MAG: hypothetical protein ABSA44_08460 [Bacteroidota bacterium]